MRCLVSQRIELHHINHKWSAPNQGEIFLWNRWKSVGPQNHFLLLISSWLQRIVWFAVNLPSALLLEWDQWGISWQTALKHFEMRLMLYIAAQHVIGDNNKNCYGFSLRLTFHLCSFAISFSQFRVKKMKRNKKDRYSEL